MPTANEILIGLLAILAGIGLAFALKRIPRYDSVKIASETREMIEKRRQEAKAYLEKVKEDLHRYKESADQSHEALKESVAAAEKIVKNKEESLARREEKLTEINNETLKLAESTKTIENEIKQLDKKQIEKLAEFTGIAQESAKEMLINEHTHRIEERKLNLLAKNEEIVTENAIPEAKNILLAAITKCNTANSVEKRSNNIKIPRESARAALIGKDGDILKYLEQHLEADIIFNDSPDTVTVTGFDLVKRNIANFTISRLMTEPAWPVGRRHITPEKINKKIAEAVKETDKIIMREGEKACKIVKMKNVPHDLMKIIGRLYFRTSYGQNILLHSIEVAFLAEIIAAELGADTECARIAGFLHDVGKAVDHEIDETHDKLTKDIMTKFGFPEDQIHAAWAHHEAVPLETAEAHIVRASDALSAGRPGARQESLDKYLERIQQLEEIAYSFEGVKKSFAISAGREIRVIIDPENVTDIRVQELAGGIAERIENEMSFPGKIKVNVIRTTRAIDFAK